MPKKVKLDDIDIQIMETLQTSKVTNKDLAKKVGLTPGPTLVRVAKLTEMGYILGAQHILNWDKMGYTYQCQVVSEVMNRHSEDFEQKLAEIPGVMYSNKLKRDIEKLSSHTYYMSKCVFRDADSFTDAWAELIAEAEYEIGFQVWELGAEVISNNIVPLDKIERSLKKD